VKIIIHYKFQPITRKFLGKNYDAYCPWHGSIWIEYVTNHKLIIVQVSELFLCIKYNIRFHTIAVFGIFIRVHKKFHRNFVDICPSCNLIGSIVKQKLNMNFLWSICFYFTFTKKYYNRHYIFSVTTQISGATLNGVSIICPLKVKWSQCWYW